MTGEDFKPGDKVIYINEEPCGKVRFFSKGVVKNVKRYEEPDGTLDRTYVTVDFGGIKGYEEGGYVRVALDEDITHDTWENRKAVKCQRMLDSLEETLQKAGLDVALRWIDLNDSVEIYLDGEYVDNVDDDTQTYLGLMIDVLERLDEEVN